MNDQNKVGQSRSANQHKKKKKNYRIRWGRILIVLFILLVLLASGVIFGILAGALKEIPSLDEASFDDYAVTTYILDKDGNYVDKLHATENRVPVTYFEISPNVINALVAIEDQRFWSHIGVDPIRIGGAFIANLQAGRTVQGGSTITQQLVGLTLLDRTEKSYTRKIQEAVLAVKMEQKYTKEEIITHYLNRAYFGDGAYGVEAAANTFFAKSAIDLSVPEAAMLAGMIQNPSKWSPVKYPENALTRRAIVLNEMAEMGYITENQATEYKATTIQLSQSSSITTDSSYANQSFVDHVINESIEALGLESNQMKLYTGGYIIHTTLDTNVQSIMEGIYANDSNFPKSSGGKLLQSAMVVMDPKTGAIQGIVGGRNQSGSRQLNRATQSYRQPGSSFKPIGVYGPAFEAGYSPGTVVDDYPKAYGSHTFSNYDYYRGLITLREAIKHSNNVAAVKMLETIGVESGYKFAESLGITSLVADGASNDKNLSFALGGLTTGVSPLEMAGAYSAFANGGVYIEPYAITKITTTDGKVIWENKVTKKAVMSEETAYMVTSALVSATSESGGTGANGAISGRPTAGKTGTTSDRKDYWFTGYTPQYVGIVWMGYDQPERITTINSAGSSCAPIFNKVMTAIHQGLPVETFVSPSGVVNVTIDTKSGLLPSELTPAEYQKSELFNQNSQPKEISAAWVEAAVDSLTGQLFTSNCPGEPVMKVFLQRAIPWQDNAVGSIVPSDASLELPTECALHANGVALDQFSLSAIGEYDGNILIGSNLSWAGLSYTTDVAYAIHRSTQAGFVANSSTLLSTTSSTNFTDFSPIANTANYYKVIAVDAITNTTLVTSNEVVLRDSSTTTPTVPETNPETPPTTSTPEPTVPNVPTVDTSTTSSVVTLSGSSSGSNVSLSWTQPGNEQYQYFVFRSTSNNFSANADTQIGKGSLILTTSFLDNTADPGVLYYYKVLAYNRSTNEKTSTSNIISVQN